MLGVREQLLLLAILLMALAGILNDYFFLLAASFACLGICLYLIYRLLFDRQTTRFFLLSSLACGAWVTGGFLQSAFYLLRRGPFVFAAIFSFSNVSIDVNDYAYGFAYLFLFILFAALTSRLSFLIRAEQLFDRLVVAKLLSLNSKVCSSILLAVSAILAFLSFAGLFSIRGLSAQYYSDQGILPWWYVFIMFLTSTLPFLITLLFSKLKSLFSFQSIIGVLGVIVGLYYNSLLGRFSLLAFVVLIAFCWVLIQRPNLSFTVKQLTIALAIVLVVLMVLPMINIFFAFINAIRWDRGLFTNPLLLLSSFLEFSSSSASLDAAIDKSADNLTFRPLVLWPLAASIRMSLEGLNSGYLYFDDLINSALNSLPRFVFPGKANLLLSENLLYTRFPFSDVDTADSPYLYSFASFGFAGALVYPFVIGLVYCSFLRLVVLASRYGLWLPACLASVSFIVGFAVISYGEMATTTLFRQFFVPSSIVLLSLVGGLLKVNRLSERNRIILQ
jgi:hypothetical protein